MLHGINGRKILLIILFLLIIFVVFNFSKCSFLNKSKNYNTEELKISNEIFGFKGIKNIVYNKIYIIGDSRMSIMHSRNSILNIPSNFTFIALSGSKLSWFENVALNELRYKMSKTDSKYRQHVIFNMGVNDLNDENSAVLHASRYYNLYRLLALNNPKINFYILSLNPIDEYLINKDAKQQRTNVKIMEFNKYITKKIEYDNIENIKYCDSFNNVVFNMPDGLHYDATTDQNIINYIVNKCVEYN